MSVFVVQASARLAGECSRGAMPLAGGKLSPHSRVSLLLSEVSMILSSFLNAAELYKCYRQLEQAFSGGGKPTMCFLLPSPVPWQLGIYILLVE